MVYVRFQDFVGSITVAPIPSHKTFRTTFLKFLPDPDDLADFELPFHESQHARERPGWRPKARLSDPDAVFPFLNTEEVREKVAAERRRLLHRDGMPRKCCKAEVCHIFCKYVIY